MDGDQVKVGVYNLYWTTFGGGEQMAGAAVDALSVEHDVELIGHDPLDLDEARERLGVHLDGVSFRSVSPDGYAATLASADYDLFVNHTYRSVAPNLAPLGLYFVMFPHQLDGAGPRQRLQAVGERWAAPVRLLGGVARRGGSAIIDGPAVLQVQPGASVVRAVLRARMPERVVVGPVRAGASQVEYEVRGTTDVEIDLDPDDVQAVIAPRLVGAERSDRQRLELLSLSVDGVAVSPAPDSARQRLVPVRHADFLRTYQKVVANSGYTLGWAQRWWGRGDGVISPPVRMRSAGDKEQLIVSLGRFFGEGSGHSKRQLELVHAFRLLVDDGLTGWKLVLIGGCGPKDREYAMEVRRAAHGLPVEVRLNAPGAVVDAHLAAASIYWHGAGYGSDLEQHPDRAEHFGIAPIEAMSAGAVPVVFDAGGPASVVTDGHDGFRWRTLPELAAQTRRLIDEPERRRTMAAAAAHTARQYDVASCEQSVRETVNEMVADRRSGR